jgi:hypothetical protein
MNTGQRMLGLALATFLFLPWVAAVVVAAPVPPLLAVNHESQECAEIFGGDECMDCFPPEGWEILGISLQVECPQGYSTVENLQVTCQGFKNQFCCSEGHSGAHGSCEDLIVNDRGKHCAFVQDIDNCVLPRNWNRKPADLKPTDWFCPANYQWLDTPLECVAGEDEGADTGTGRSFCPFAAGIGPAVIVLWLLVKRTR